MEYAIVASIYESDIVTVESVTKCTSEWDASVVRATFVFGFEAFGYVFDHDEYTSLVDRHSVYYRDDYRGRSTLVIHTTSPKGY